MSNIQTDNLKPTDVEVDPQKVIPVAVSGETPVPIRRIPLAFPLDLAPFMSKVIQQQELGTIKVRDYCLQLDPMAEPGTNIYHIDVDWDVIHKRINVDPFYLDNYNFVSFVFEIDINLQTNPFFIGSAIATFDINRNLDLSNTAPEEHNKYIKKMYDQNKQARSLPFDIIQLFRDDKRTYTIPAILPFQAIRNLDAPDEQSYKNYRIGTFSLRYFTPVRCLDPTTISKPSLEIYISALVAFGCAQFESAEK